jgi:DmsE family decaheme c-type cytochrome
VLASARAAGRIGLPMRSVRLVNPLSWHAHRRIRMIAPHSMGSRPHPPRVSSLWARRASSLVAIGCGLVLVIIACASDRETAALEAARAEARVANSSCAGCHENEATDLDASRHHGGLAHAVGCLDCHFEHPVGLDGERLASTTKARCEDCHPEAAAEFRLPFAHPLGTTIGCTSCHAAHGLPPREQRRHEREEACVACHIEKRGPFVFPHEGDKTQQCLSCHEPHGSPNRRLLTHADSRSLCFSCHEILEDVHVQNPGSIFRECLHCHTQVHGSNWDGNLFR